MPSANTNAGFAAVEFKKVKIALKFLKPPQVPFTVASATFAVLRRCNAGAFCYLQETRRSREPSNEATAVLYCFLGPFYDRFPTITMWMWNFRVFIKKKFSSIEIICVGLGARMPLIHICVRASPAYTCSWRSSGTSCPNASFYSAIPPKTSFHQTSRTGIIRWPSKGSIASIPPTGMQSCHFKRKLKWMRLCNFSPKDEFPIDYSWYVASAAASVGGRHACRSLPLMETNVDTSHPRNCSQLTGCLIKVIHWFICGTAKALAKRAHAARARRSGPLRVSPLSSPALGARFWWSGCWNS